MSSLASSPLVQAWSARSGVLLHIAAPSVVRGALAIEIVLDVSSSMNPYVGILFDCIGNWVQHSCPEGCAPASCPPLADSPLSWVRATWS